MCLSCLLSVWWIFDVDVAKYITDYFVGKYTIKSIQQCQGRVARVTFVEPEARSTVEKLEHIELNGVSCPVLAPPPHHWNVYVYLYPYGSSDQPIINFFWSLWYSRFCSFPNLDQSPCVSTGTRIIRMVRRNHIPWFVIINGHCCNVWYTGQPLNAPPR